MPATAPVYHVAPDVRELALQLAGRDRRRLEVTAHDTVTVHNRPQG